MDKIETELIQKNLDLIIEIDIKRAEVQKNINELMESIKKATEILLDKHPINNLIQN